ncbi:hypothetical protein PUG81_05195 [Erwiniaceae bacterium L1_54_6]|nr:hypothetical protein [Erwiniaceae bacterium L1_54_6]
MVINEEKCQKAMAQNCDKSSNDIQFIQDAAMQPQKEIMLTHDVLERYKISRSTLYFWSTPARMPASFARPFPKPVVGGSPRRWRTSELLKWEEEVNAVSVVAQSPFPDENAIHPTSDVDHQDNREDCSEP